MSLSIVVVLSLLTTRVCLVLASSGPTGIGMRLDCSVVVMIVTIRVRRSVVLLVGKWRLGAIIVIWLFSCRLWVSRLVVVVVATCWQLLVVSMNTVQGQSRSAIGSWCCF